MQCSSPIPHRKYLAPDRNSAEAVKRILTEGLSGCWIKSTVNSRSFGNRQPWTQCSNMNLDKSMSMSMGFLSGINGEG